ncbi:makorin, ring finger protein, 4 [Denticeps clupeoides]|uniref:RING-type E3 ubiquitin transferase n=1 Tax=Denticeps clupeoides TaxID=299321 RepID=A0AAY4DFW8_9TELE|nr:probable E3 ubiquitin-protein ligase makorin-1 [Denticeps clupeoides]
MSRHRLPPWRPNKRSSAADRRVCRHFISGSCRFGPNCYYLHEWPESQICRYFQKGLCWYGDSCRYIHVPQANGGTPGGRRGSAPAGSLPGRRGSEPSLNTLGFRRQGRRGSEPVVTNVTNTDRVSERIAPNIAEDEEGGVTDGVTHPQQPVVAEGPSVQVPDSTSGSSSPTDQGAADVGKGGARSPETDSGAAASASAGNTTAYEQSKDVSCGICMDKVYEKSSPHKRRFGILPNCIHAFCLECIVAWRKTKDFQEDVVKSCPQCRVKSPFYVPNGYWVEGKQKELLITSFKERSSKINCTFFMRDGCCPFKSECIYRHELPPGFVPHRRRPAFTHHSLTMEDFENDGFQILDYVIALTLLGDSDDDFLDDDDDFDDDLFSQHLEHHDLF